MFTEKRFKIPVFKDGGVRDLEALAKAFADYLLSLESPGSIGITEANITPKSQTGTGSTFVMDTDPTLTKLTVQSGAAGALATISIGRTGLESTWGVVASGDQFFTGTAAGDVALGYGAGKLWIGTGDLDTAGASAITIDSSRNVGIGSASAEARLDIGAADYKHVVLTPATGTNKAFINKDATSLYIDLNRDTATGTFGDTGAAHARIAMSASSGDSYISLLTGSANNTIATERIRVTGDGRLYGTTLHNNSGAVTGTTNQYIASGTYTPTDSANSNLDSATPAECQWMRVGNVCTVSGQVTADPTATGVCSFELSLPIASTFTTASDANGAGTFVHGSGQFDPVAIFTANTKTTAIFQWYASEANSYSISFSFTYEIK